MWPLPLPLLLALGALIGFAANRLRGDVLWRRWTGGGIGTARIMWGAAMGLLAWAAGHGTPEAVLVGIGFHIGATPPWWRSVTLGENAADGPVLGQYLRHALRGLLWTAPAGLLLIAGQATLGFFYSSAYGWHLVLDSPGWWLVAAGLGCVPAYQVGKWISPPRENRTPGMTEWGEGIFGAIQGAAVVLSAA